MCCIPEMYAGNLNIKGLILVNSKIWFLVIPLLQTTPIYTCWTWQRQKHEDTKIKAPSYKTGGPEWELAARAKYKVQLYESRTYKVQPRTMAAIVKIWLVQRKEHGYTKLLTEVISGEWNREEEEKETFTLTLHFCSV